MTRIIGIFILLFSTATVAYGDTNTTKAKAAFAFVDVQIPKCKCLNCTCKDCQCKDGDCKCKDCDSYEAVYAKAVKEDQVVVLEVGGVVHLTNTSWRIIQVKSIQGENAGYIVGVPKGGIINRIDFSVYHTRENIRMGILHFLYPLTPGYAECSQCPQGRIWIGK